MGEPSESLAAFVQALERRFGADLVSVVLYGSYARGEASPESDLDLLVVAEGLPVSRLKRHRLLLDIAEEVSPDLADALGLLPLTPEQASRTHPCYLGMLSGHRLLHDRGGFFAGVLARLQERLDQLGSRRLHDEDGYEYWDLKPDWKPGDVVEL